MGIYRRPSGVYWLNLTIDGGQRWESCKTHNKATAKKILAIRQAEIVEGRYNLPASNPPRLKEWMTDFLNSIEHPSTKSRYNSSIKQILSFFGERARLTEISVSRIEVFKRKRLADGLKAAGCNRDLAVLRRALNLAERQRLISRNPFAQIDMLEERKTRRQATIVSFEIERKILEYAPTHLRTLFTLLVETGLRIKKEALALKWRDVDFANLTLTVRNSKSLAGRRVVHLSNRCKDALQDWRDLVTIDSEFVFPNMSNPLKPLGSVKKTWATTLKKATIEPFPIYSLRATHASRLSAAGVPDSFVSQMLGHSGGLLQTYSKAIDQYRRDAIRKLEELRKANTGCNEAAVFFSNSRPIEPSGAQN